MAVIKNKKTNTYEVRTYYKDWTGVRKQRRMWHNMRKS